MGVAGCGSKKSMSEVDQAYADAELALYPVQWSGCLVELTKDGSCGEAELEEITDKYLQAVREQRDAGYPTDELRQQFIDAADDLEGYCPVCVAKLDRERETLG